MDLSSVEGLTTIYGEMTIVHSFKQFHCSYIFIFRYDYTIAGRLFFILLYLFQVLSISAELNQNRILPYELIRFKVGITNFVLNIFVVISSNPK